MSEIIKASVEVAFKTTSGYETRAGSTQPGTTSLEWGLRETARVLAIALGGERVREIVSDVVSAVETDLHDASQAAEERKS